MDKNNTSINMNLESTNINSIVQKAYVAAFSKVENDIGIDVHEKRLYKNTIDKKLINEKIGEVLLEGRTFSLGIFKGNDMDLIKGLESYINEITPQVKKFYDKRKQKRPLMPVDEPRSEFINGSILADRIYNAFHAGLITGRMIYLDKSRK
jgi:hypothetical protein